MKIGHLSMRDELYPGPHIGAQESVEAERALGIDSRIVDIQEGASRTPIADIMVWHALPDATFLGLPAFKKSKHVLFLHAMPEYWLGQVLEGGALFDNISYCYPRMRPVARNQRAASVYAHFFGKPCNVIPMSIDLSKWKPQGPRENFSGNPPILCMDTLSNMKNPMNLVDVIPKGAVLYVLGDELMKKKMLAFQDKVRIIPRVKDPSVYYRAAPITISSLPAWVDELSRAEIEAAACGSWPVRREGLAEALREYSMSSRGLSDAAVEWAKKYDMRYAAEAMKRIYEEVIEG